MPGKEPAYPDEFIGWLQRDKREIKGLDHLGVQTVSIAVYNLLLPGITNLTDRARYFSIFPWVLHSFAQLPDKKRSAIGWRNWIRSHEFALVIASKTFEDKHDDPELSTKSIIGTDHTSRVLKSANDKTVIDIAGGSRLNSKGKVPRGAYFKNMEGGYRQYYKGALTKLGILFVDEENRYPDRLVTKYAGLPLAKAVASTKGFDQLTEAALGGSITVGDAVSLGELVHPGMIDPDGEESGLLRKILFGEEGGLCSGQDPRDIDLRRSSLSLILRYISEEPVSQSEFPQEFRWAVMTGMLGDGKHWKIPKSLAPMASAWAAYQRLELLNYALECLFWVAMYMVDERPSAPDVLADRIMKMAIAPIKATNTNRALPALEGSFESSVRKAQVPKKIGGQFWGKESTWQWNSNLVDAEENQAICGWAARVLLRIVTDRGAFKSHPFEAIPEAVEITSGHRISYKRWLDRAKARSTENIKAFLVDLVKEWVIFRHLRVATRKLANQGVTTFKFRPHEGVIITSAETFPSPTYTNPRLVQAVQIMKDLHLVEARGGVMQLTKTGKKYLGLMT